MISAYFINISSAKVGPSKMWDHCSLRALLSARFHQCLTVMAATGVALKLSPVWFCSAGYDVQSASTPDGVLYITGAPRYNHTGRVVVYRLSKKNQIVVSQILKGEQVGEQEGR